MSKENISTIFLLPSIEISELTKDKFYKFGFINTYITSNSIKYPFEVMFLLFKPEKFDSNYNKFELELINNPNYIEVYDLGNKEVLYVFRIPKKYKRDYLLFIEGQYSKLSKSYKELFPEKSYVFDSNKRPVKNNKGGYITEMSPFYHVFTRSEYLRSKWADKMGYDLDDPIFNDLELYEVQDSNKEQILINIEL